jgi:hypothetical protein
MSRRQIHQRSLLGAAVAVLVAFSLAPVRAAADEPDASAVNVAERRAAEAFQAYAKKDYATAIALYLQAYDAAPSGSILYNIARIYDLKLHDRAQALAFYTRYVADPEARPELVAVSHQRLRELTNADNGDVAPVVRDAAPRAAPEAADQRRGGWSSLRWTGVAAGAVGLAGIGIGSGYGLAAMSKADVAKGSCNGNACTSQAGVDAAKNARSLGTISTAGFLAGGALLAAGAVLFFSGSERSVESPSELHLEALATTSAASLQVVGRW